MSFPFLDFQLFVHSTGPIPVTVPEQSVLEQRVQYNLRV